MRYIRQHILFRLFWLLMTIHVINLSVDPVDPIYSKYVEDTTINEMESILEIVAEQVMDIENCFPEHDDNDQQGSAVFEIVKTFTYCPQFPNFESFLLQTHDIKCLPELFQRLSNQHNPEILSPPPKQAA